MEALRLARGIYLSRSEMIRLFATANIAVIAIRRERDGAEVCVVAFEQRLRW